jgi:hypothetical protein
MHSIYCGGGSGDGDEATAGLTEPEGSFWQIS